jgi:hypothetical protein
MSYHIKGQSRTQITRFPEALDEFVTEDNLVRVIDVFVNSLDIVETLTNNKHLTKVIPIIASKADELDQFCAKPML